MNFFAWYWSFCVVAGVLYALLIIWFLNGWNNISIFRRQNRVYKTKVSVLVPFYNEELNLVKCIEGLIAQNIQTTEYEILLIDDQSTDNSTKIAKDFATRYRRINYYLNENKGKKRALLKGIEVSGGNFIVTTDADCIHPEFWLANLVEYYETFDPNFIAGPVALITGNSFVQKFQQFEFISLVASGAGAIGINHAIMCNGANLAFKKEAFLELDDPLNLEYQSGDDVFLLHNMKMLDSDKIHFIKCEETIVQTPSKDDLKAFIRQRKRWTSKAPGYTDGDTRFTSFIVFTASFLWVIGLFALPFNLEFWKPILFLFLLKSAVDALFISQVSPFFKQKFDLKIMPLFQLFYGFYVASITISALLRRK